jgi:hypothetical protein
VPGQPTRYGQSQSVIGMRCAGALLPRQTVLSFNSVLDGEPTLPRAGRVSWNTQRDMS